MSKYSTIAKKETVLCEIFNGRDKIETEELTKMDCISINRVEPVNLDDESFYAFTFEENDKVFAFSGLALSNIFDKIIESEDGDIGEVNNNLAKEPLKVKLQSVKTKKSKQQFTKVTVI